MALIEYLQKSIYMNLIYEDRYQLILSGLWVTLLLTVVSFVLGTVLGMAFCAGKGSRNRVSELTSYPIAIIMFLSAMFVFCWHLGPAAPDRRAFRAPRRDAV